MEGMEGFEDEGRLTVSLDQSSSPLSTGGCQSLLKVILGGVSGCKIRVHMVLMSSEDVTLRWKLNRIWTDTVRWWWWWGKQTGQR